MICFIYLTYRTSIFKYEKIIWNRKDLQPNKKIIEIYKNGSVIIIDDILHDAPAKVVKFIDANYKFMRRKSHLPIKTMATYVKINDDYCQWVNFNNF